jgi:hypothetical protein
MNYSLKKLHNIVTWFGSGLFVKSRLVPPLSWNNSWLNQRGNHLEPVQVITNFSSSLLLKRNKLECLSLSLPFQLSQGLKPYSHHSFSMFLTSKPHKLEWLHYTRLDRWQTLQLIGVLKKMKCWIYDTRVLLSGLRPCQQIRQFNVKTFQGQTL